MPYDRNDNIYKMLAHEIQEDRIRELEHQRLVGEALAGYREGCTRSRPSLVDWLQKLAEREPRVTTEPAG